MATRFFIYSSRIFEHQLWDQVERRLSFGRIVNYHRPHVWRKVVCIKLCLDTKTVKHVGKAIDLVPKKFHFAVKD